MRRFPWAFAALNLAVICFHLSLYGGWNELSRALPLLSFIEEGALHIDARHQLTGDKAFVGGHYYSDKAPGTTLLALPVYALARAALSSSRCAEDLAVAYSTRAVDPGGDQTLAAHLLRLPLAGRVAIWGAAFALLLASCRRRHPSAVPVSAGVVSVASKV
jgi:hypothetical protein